MRSRSVSLVGLGVLVMIATTAPAGAAMTGSSAPRPAGAVASIGSATLRPAAANDVCFDSVSEITDWAVSSQDYEAANDAYDSEAAADVQLRRDCKVKSIQVVGGYFSGDGPATSFDIRFYRDKHGLPQNRPFTERLDVAPVVEDRYTFGFDITPPVTVKKAERVWISVQANMDYEPDQDQWGWTTTEESAGRPATWRNEGDGYQVCDRWTVLESCWPDAYTDLMLRLSKRPLQS